MMFYLNAFSTVFSFITLVHTQELTPFFQFVTNHPSIHWHFWLFSICSTIGQVATGLVTLWCWRTLNC
jgi:solute carrier family 35 (adenosine 3'-phospho 5'-phosphosulfate transporter), member B2